MTNEYGEPVPRFKIGDRFTWPAMYPNITLKITKVFIRSGNRIAYYLDRSDGGMHALFENEIEILLVQE